MSSAIEVLRVWSLLMPFFLSQCYWPRGSFNRKTNTLQNSPQYIASSDFEKELELQYRVHSALDVVEEKCAPGLKPTQDSRDLYLGLLYSTESHKM